MKIARFLITPELLFQDFPEGMRVHNARVKDDANGCYLEFTVEHDDLKDVAVTEPLPTVEPRFRRDDTGAVHFDGWGL